MEVDQYIREHSSMGFPLSLVLSKDIAGEFYRMWNDGERRGIEIGANMSFQHGLMAIGNGPFYGKANYTEFPPQNAGDICGDVHTHPANSIGHVNGYAAHSLSDIRALRNNLAKSVFIRFVVSGYHIYAVVYRNGVSELNERLIQQLTNDLDETLMDLFLEKANLTADQRIEILSGFPDQNQADMWSLNKKKSAPGFGAEVERLSIEYCTYVTRRMNLGFYRGCRGLFGWYSNQPFVLKLVRS